MRRSLPRHTQGGLGARGSLTTFPPTQPNPFTALGQSTAAFRVIAGDTMTTIARTRNTAEAVPVVLPVPQPRSRTLPVPMWVVIALDASGSTETSDPNRESQQATLAICDWLSRHSQDREDRIGLVRFADRADTVPAVRAAKARRAFQRALAAAVDVGGGTRLAPAIGALCQLLADREPARGLAILITDGQVAEADAELWELIEQLHEHADAVYVLGLDHDGAWSGHTQDRYQRLGLAGRIAISQPTQAQLAQAIAVLLAYEAGLTIR